MKKNSCGILADPPTHEEVLNALRVLRAECLQHDDCSACPLHVEYVCMSCAEAPADWQIKPADDTVWCAFLDK